MEKPTDKQIAILEKNNRPIPATKQEAMAVIGELFAKSDSEKAVKSATADEKAQKNSIFYIAYTKDLTIAMLNASVSKQIKDSHIEPIAVEKLAETATEIMKGIIREFE